MWLGGKVVCQQTKRRAELGGGQAGKPLEIPNWNSVYFNVNPSSRKMEGYERGDIHNISAVNSLYGDYDKKDGWTLNRINMLLPTPSVVISSGGGWHCYWLLKEPIILNDQNLAEVKSLQGRWVAYVGSDPNAKDLARVLRILGSFNNKNGEVNEVRYYRINLNYRYDLETIKGMLGTESAIIRIENKIDYQNFDDQLNFAVTCLAKLSPKRVEDYDKWTSVGMCLKKIGTTGLILWDDWSKKSNKYRPGECAKKWEIFDTEGGLTLGSLKYWADEDTPYEIENATKNSKPVDYLEALSKLGYTFKLNECNDEIYMNGIQMNDITYAVARYELKNRGYANQDSIDLAFKTLANMNKFHPVVEYLESLAWNGNDQIENLSSYIKDEDNVFPIWIRRWLIGCVAKVLEKPKGSQNRMLILDGKQVLGKSYFVRWLCSPLPAYHIESPINLLDKDTSIRKMLKWIWEVSELGASIRKSDRESLKSFLTEQTVTVRKSYGRTDTIKPALANFIGTINNEAGFLIDPTGSRRFMSCTLMGIDHKYSKYVDINQLWAYAVHLYKTGVPWELTDKEKEISNKINKKNEVENPVAEYLLKYFLIDASQKNWIMPTIEIIEELQRHGYQGAYDSNKERNIASALKSFGLEKTQLRLPNYPNPMRVWLEIKK